MLFAGSLRRMFPDLHPVVDDLFLLEAHQIASLPERAPSRELAAVLHAHPHLHRFFVARHPPIEEFLERLLSEQSPAGGESLVSCERALVWELSDWIVYQRAPESYAARAGHWELATVTELVALDGKVVIDAGAGTGVVAFAASSTALHVFAVEPVARLRQYMRERATRLGINNLFVLDGFLHAIPLPAACADVLLTHQSIGWNLEEELPEIERVVKPGGIALHLFEADAALPDSPILKTLAGNGYQPSNYQGSRTHKQRYWKQIGG